MKSYWMLIIMVTVLLVTPALYADTPSPCPDWVSQIVSLQGQVLVKRSGQSQWQPARLNDIFCPGDAIRVAADSRAAFALRNESVLRIDQNTTLTFKGVEKKRSFLIELLRGVAHFFSRESRSLKVATPFVNGVVEGTEFYVRVDEDQTLISLFEGRIRTHNAQGSLLLIPGQSAIAAAAQPPRLEMVVRPQDAVQWALYYPPVLAFTPEDFPPQGANDWQTKAHQSLQALQRGDLPQALAYLRQVSDTVEAPDFWVLRAGMLLTVGRITQAQSDLNQALALDSTNGNALALRAVIAVVQNRKADASKDAQRAVQIDPHSAAAHIALSYAHQAQFDIPAALAQARAAVTTAPENAIARARQAELHLSSGELDQALSAARKAAELNPKLASTHTILGFAYLTRIEIPNARQAFEQAIQLDSAAPLPRLGLGLAQIRDGQLKQGRAQIEIAMGLDPHNALIRSYLGKAYFEEKRPDLDQRQFDIAKALDPNDPTPWLYDALRKQSLNRPGEALQDLQHSIKLNDNRAVYRSRLLLDEDLAARNASLGKIYNDLGFQELALRQGWRSLHDDPTNYSAHRLLAEMYAARPRHEIARVSELLQAQLYQPLNTTPVAPQMAESAYLTGQSTGSDAPSINDYDSLFVRNQVNFQANGMLGEHSTRSDELTLSGLHQQHAFSLGQYHYESEGFRKNNELKKDIYNAFGQTAFSPHLSAQLEYRIKRTYNGDLWLRFDPEDYLENFSKTREEMIPRLGVHYSSDPQHHFIGSVFYNQTDFELLKQEEAGPGPFGPRIISQDYTQKIDAYLAESQYLFHGNTSNLIIGAGYYNEKYDETLSILMTSGSAVLLDLPGQPQEIRIRHSNAYVYFNTLLLPTLDATIGFSADAYDKGEIEARQINPKLGFNWRLTPAFTIRAAAFNTLKRSLVSNQTIEPTQVVGFTQFFDDKVGTDSRNYGIGVDYKATDSLFAGSELVFRYLQEPKPKTVTGSVREEDFEEMLHRLYLYWMPYSQIAIGGEYLFEQYERDLLTIDRARPHDLRTQYLPLTVSYSLPNGVFTRVRSTYVDQSLERIATDVDTSERHHESFTVFDTELGYRLPRRLGTVSIAVTNLFDTNFNFQDTNFLTANEQVPMFVPERQIMIKGNLRF